MILAAIIMILTLSGISALTNTTTKYSAAIIFTITLICTTALLITGIIEI